MTGWKTTIAPVLLALALGACGGGGTAAATGTATASADGTAGSDSTDTTGSTPRRRRRRSHGSDASADASDTSDTSSDTADAELPLDPPTPVPGTGVTVSPPRGSRALPVGAGFVHARRRIQMVVAVAQGDEGVLHGVEASLGADADVIAEEDVQLGGRTAHLVVDSQMAGEIELERQWILVREGDRAMAIVGAYLADRSERLRPLVRAALMSAQWDTTVALDPERAVGFRLGAPPEGLVAERQVVSTLTYAMPGTAPTPASGNPALLVVPIPMQIPAAQRATACEQILLQAGPVEEDSVTSRATIAGDDLEGCEVFGTQELEEPAPGGPSEIATYAAILFVGDASFMVAGFVDAHQRDVWGPRFSAAARTVAPVAR
jgi:hypothetical protein